MSNAARTNSAFEELAAVTGLPEEQLEWVAADEMLQNGVEKFVRNLTKCLGAFNEQLQHHDANKDAK